MIDRDGGHFVQGQRTGLKGIKAAVRHASFKVPHKKTRGKKKNHPNNEKCWHIGFYQVLSEVPFVFFAYIKRDFFHFSAQTHTNAKMKPFLPDSELFLSVALKFKDGWNNGFTALLYILHMLRQRHQEGHKGFDSRKPFKKHLHCKCNTVIYMITGIGATDKKITMNGIFLTIFPWKQPEEAWKHRQHLVCLLHLPSSRHKVKHSSVTLYNKTC